jgi:hypothetical protein
MAGLLRFLRPPDAGASDFELRQIRTDEHPGLSSQLVFHIPKELLGAGVDPPNDACGVQDVALDIVSSACSFLLAWPVT